MLNRSSRYSIKDIEHLSNVKAHTIRIWEQRYNLLSPARTNTNIRYYDDEQLKKLLNVNTLLNHGMKISVISKMSDQQIINKVDEVLKETTSSQGKKEALISKSIISVLSYDEISFEKIFNTIIAERGLINTYSDLIYPLLVRTGMMWASNEMMPSQEHFLSNLLERKIQAAIDTLPLPKESNEKWLLFLPEGEEHEIGLLMVNFILRKYNREVLYLGRRLPVDNLYSVIREYKPTHLFTFFIRNFPEHEISELLNDLTWDFKKLLIKISGRIELIEKLKMGSRVQWIKELNSLLEMLNNNAVE